MIKIENTEVVGWEAAIRGMRNPMNSWGNSDSLFMDREGDVHAIDNSINTYYDEWDCYENFFIGSKDLNLMKKLRDSGTDHRKFMRMITVYLDITAPLYWWKEFDTYKVGTVANSCSTMHKIHDKEFTLDDFSHEHLVGGVLEVFKSAIEALNIAREAYLEYDSLSDEEKDVVSSVFPCKKDIWWQMIQMLPSSYNQKRTIQLNYEVLANMYKSRKDHKLDEWRDFCKWIESLPYSELITGGNKK